MVKPPASSDAPGVKSLIRCCLEGDLEGAHSIVSSSSSGAPSVSGSSSTSAGSLALNRQDDQQRTPLSVACSLGHVGLVKLLLSLPATNPNTPGPEGKTPLLISIMSNLPAIARLLLLHPKTNLNLASDAGVTPLHALCLTGDLDLLRLLLRDARVDVNRPKPGGATPLHTALGKGKAPAVELLLACPRVDLFAAKADGTTLLMAACLSSRGILVEMLLARDPQPPLNEAREDGMTALHLAAEKSSPGPLVELLRHPGIRPNTVARGSGDTALHIACRHGREECVRHLLRHQLVHVNTQNTHGQTPFLLACAHNHVGIIGLLLGIPRCRVNLADVEGCTGFFLACQQGHTEVVRQLLETPSVDVNQANKRRETPLGVSAKNHHQIISSLIFENPRFAPAVGLSKEDTELYDQVKKQNASATKYPLRLAVVKTERPSSSSSSSASSSSTLASASGFASASTSSPSFLSTFSSLSSSSPSLASPFPTPRSFRIKSEFGPAPSKRLRRDPGPLPDAGDDAPIEEDENGKLSEGENGEGSKPRRRSAPRERPEPIDLLAHTHQELGLDPIPLLESSAQMRKIERVTKAKPVIDGLLAKIDEEEVADLEGNERSRRRVLRHIKQEQEASSPSTPVVVVPKSSIRPVNVTVQGIKPKNAVADVTRLGTLRPREGQLRRTFTRRRGGLRGVRIKMEAETTPQRNFVRGTGGWRVRRRAGVTTEPALGMDSEDTGEPGSEDDVNVDDDAVGEEDGSGEKDEDTGDEEEEEEEEEEDEGNQSLEHLHHIGERLEAQEKAMEEVRQLLEQVQKSVNKLVVGTSGPNPSSTSRLISAETVVKLIGGIRTEKDDISRLREELAVANYQQELLASQLREKTTNVQALCQEVEGCREWIQHTADRALRAEQANAGLVEENATLKRLVTVNSGTVPSQDKATPDPFSPQPRLTSLKFLSRATSSGRRD